MFKASKTRMKSSTSDDVAHMTNELSHMEIAFLRVVVVLRATLTEGLVAKSFEATGMRKAGTKYGYALDTILNKCTTHVSTQLRAKLARGGRTGGYDEAK
jgi:hypothetical protein